MDLTQSLKKILTIQLPRMLTIAILILFVVTVPGAVLMAADILPPDKQVIEDRYTQDLAAGQQNPATPNPNAPPPYPDILQYEFGIFDCKGGECASQGLFIINFWQDTVNDEHFLVDAGGFLDASGTPLLNNWDSGMVFIEKGNVGYDPVVFTPLNNGPVKITAARDLQLGLVSTSGGSFIFDVLSGTFVKTVPTPDTTPPICSISAVGRNSQGNTYIQISIQDTISGLATIDVVQANNANVVISPFSLGSTLPDTVTATKINPHSTAKVSLDVMDVASNKTVCGPVIMPVIDIKPGSLQNPINLKSKGKIPVAILSTKDFDSLTVSTNALTFGRTGDEHSLAFCNTNGEDVNSDGLLDRVCHFNTNLTAFQPGDTKGILKGLYLGNIIIGVDSVRIVPE